MTFNRASLYTQNGPWEHFIGGRYFDHTLLGNISRQNINGEQAFRILDRQDLLPVFMERELFIHLNRHPLRSESMEISKIRVLGTWTTSPDVVQC
jgi:hypothetical protein